MLTSTDDLIAEVEEARKQFIHSCSGLSTAQSEFRSDPDSWSVRDIAEHMVWAERSGTVGMWKALASYQSGKPLWTGENPSAGLSIEEVVDRTWQPKEKVPKIAEPKWGGPLEFWIASLKSCTPVLLALGKELEKIQLEIIIYPHPISGPLDARQRLDFLRFHLDRHRGQVERVKENIGYPK